MLLPVRPPTLKHLLKVVYPVLFILFSISLPSRKKIVIFLTISFFITGPILLSGWYFFLKDLPSPSSLTTRSVPLTTHIRDRNGQELYKIYASQNRTLVKLSDLPPYLPQAIIAIEDKDFYAHNGFSLRGTLRAAWRIITNQRLEGGSTITQQLVKTALLTPDRSIGRKVRELLLSYAVELKFTKDQILEMYLNRVSFGGPSYGIEEAARTYFGIPASNLSLPQAALLAGLPAAPTTFSPYGAHPELAKDRQIQVLRQMAQNSFITWDTATSASALKLEFRPPAANLQAPHFVMYIKDQLIQKYGAALVEQGGLDVTTTLDLNLHEKVQALVAQETANLAYLHVTNGAALVTKPSTGEILSMVGSRDYFDVAHDGAVNVTLRPRQPGSAIKPVNYALALSKGWTPASIIDDSPITFSTPGSPPYSPVNYDRKYHGKVTLRTALASSYNVPAVKLLAALGVQNLISFGRNLGITTWDTPNRFGLSLTLGGGEVTMADMSVVYGTFANSGRRVDLVSILKVTDSRGRIFEEFTPPTHIETVINPHIAFLISDILSDNAARAPTFGPKSKLLIPQSRVAVKTGTTNNLRDNWTIGYTPDFLVAVWVGNNDNTPMSYIASGVTGATPIWRSITDYLLQLHPFTAFTSPEGLAKLTICGGRTDFFLPGTVPPPCPTTPTPTPHTAIAPTPIDRILTGISTLDPTPRPRPPKTPRLPRIPKIHR